MVKQISKEELEKKLKNELKDWSLKEDFIEKEFLFKDFKSAFSFMTFVALRCEEINHHPDWSNVYNKVLIKLQTHSIKGISNLDLELAIFIDKVYSKFLLD